MRRPAVVVPDRAGSVKAWERLRQEIPDAGPPEDPRAMADVISSLLADAERRRQMGEAGRHRALKEFSIQPMVEGTAGVYRRATILPGEKGHTRL